MKNTSLLRQYVLDYYGSDFKLQNFDYPCKIGTACNLDMRTEQLASLVSHDADASNRKIDENQNQPFCIEQLKTIIQKNTGCT